MSVSYDPDGDTCYLGGEDVSAEIRGGEVTRAVSAVSSVSAVRARLVTCSAPWPLSREAS